MPVSRSQTFCSTSLWWPSPQPISSKLHTRSPNARWMCLLVSAKRCRSGSESSFHGSGIRYARSRRSWASFCLTPRSAYFIKARRTAVSSLSRSLLRTSCRSMRVSSAAGVAAGWNSGLVTELGDRHLAEEHRLRQVALDGDAADVEAVDLAHQQGRAAGVGEADLVAGGGDRVADAPDMGDRPPDRVRERAHRLAQLALEVGARPGQLVGERGIVEGLQHAVAPGVRLDVHAGVAQRADLVPVHDQVIGEAALEAGV